MPTNRLLAALAALALSAGVARASPPTVLTYSGFLMDSAGTAPLSGVHDFNFRFYTLATGGTQIGTGDITVSTTVGSDGFFSVVIDVSSIANDPLFKSQMYMSVRVDADVNPMTPRVQVTSAPGALSVPYGGITGFPTTQCGAGQFATGFDVNGNLVCASAQGGVTSVAAGTGVSVSASTGAVTVSANLATAGGDNGASASIARADHAHDARYVQPGALSAVGTINTPGNPVDWSQLKNVPAGLADGVDAVGLTAVSVGSGLAGDGTSGAPITLPACATSGYALKWNGAAYACAPDVDTNTTYAAGSGLALLGSSFSIASGGVSPAMLAPAAVETAALANGAVTAAKLAPDAVTSVAIADGAVTFAKLNQNGCGPNQSPRWNGTSWACGSPLNDAGCAPGQVLKWNGGEFNCQADLDTPTSYSAGAGLSLTGSTFGIADLGVASSMLADGSVTNAKLAAGAVSASSPLVGDGTSGAPLGLTACALGTGGQALTWNGAVWTCDSAIRTVGAITGGGINVIGTGADLQIGLLNSGVAPGTYTAVNVDAFGRVTAGGSYTSLSGYGITDGVQLQTHGSAIYQTGDVAILNDVWVGNSVIANSFVGVLSGNAATATTASAVSSGAVLPSSLSSSVGPTTGQVPSKAAGDSFTWITPVTGISPGSGIAVTGSAPSPTVSVSFAGSGAATTAARSDHTHTSSVVPIALDSFQAQFGTPTLGTFSYGTFLAVKSWTMPANTCIITSTQIPTTAPATRYPTIVVNAGAVAAGTASWTVSGTFAPPNTTLGNCVATFGSSGTLTTVAGQAYRASHPVPDYSVACSTPVATAGPGDVMLFRICTGSGNTTSIAVTSVQVYYPN